MSNPLVSVIIPCYNQAHFLERAVQSCLNQSLKEIEIIVINDGSTDNTEEVANKFKELPHFKYHKRINGGLSAARNTGIELATGKYLQFLDSDDFIHPDKLKVQVDLLEKNPQYAYSYCDIIRVSTEEKVVDEYTVNDSRPILTGNIFTSLLIGGFFPPISALVKKSVLDQFGAFTLGLDGHADYELWLRLAANNQECIFVNQKLAYYTLHDSNMSKNIEHMNKTFCSTIEKISKEHPEAFSKAFLFLHNYIEGIKLANITLQSEINGMKQHYENALNPDSELISRLQKENEKLKVLLKKQS